MYNASEKNEYLVLFHWIWNLNYYMQLVATILDHTMNSVSLIYFSEFHTTFIITIWLRIIILRCINNSLIEISRVVIIMVPVHYSEKIRIMTSNRKKYIGQSPGQNRHRTICCHLQQKWCKQPVFLPEMMFDNSCTV